MASCVLRRRKRSVSRVSSLARPEPIAFSAEEAPGWRDFNIGISYRFVKVEPVPGGADTKMRQKHFRSQVAHGGGGFEGWGNKMGPKASGLTKSTMAWNSVRLFWTGVPVRAMRFRHRSDVSATKVFDLIFFSRCASSQTMMSNFIAEISLTLRSSIS